ncbi:helix-turn-helix domain-containing protein [Profundibacterium mesophilum]|uniref:helix-turn-helix domain-containing protein n=1 Tax=Profundibacterium mesophilum TaxID=1258573 RepID=UPI001356A7F2|nr:helix-turn-helix domain-containing protein [Profundibacterium mesophilum]
MSISDPDPGKGFVALPVDLLDIAMSPGAFRALAEFCRMADRDGYCWPSLQQIGTRLGRSRAAISGYISELRKLGLLATQEQQTANGYNYRLKFCVPFWKTWRARLSQGKSRKAEGAARDTGCTPAVGAQETERSVHSAERPKEKNQIHENQPSGKLPKGRLQKMHEAWKKVIGSAPYPACERMPEPTLVAETRKIAVPGPRPDADLGTVLDAFLQNRFFAVDTEWRCNALKALAPLARIPGGAESLSQCLAAEWRSHWRYPPSLRFLTEMRDRIVAANPEPALAALLAGYLRRWENHSSRLSGRLRCSA